MPPIAYMNPEPWMDCFEKRDQAAKEGRYLPSLGDLYSGMSFLKGSITADAKAWSAYIIPHLANKGQEIPRNPVQIALERLMVSARIEDLEFVHEEISNYKITLDMFEEITRAERRLVFYLVGSGDESVWPYLLDDLFFTIRWLMSETGSLGQGIL
jgi:hypothetical protein